MKEVYKRANDPQITSKEVHMAQTRTNITQELVLRKSPKNCLSSPLSGASSGSREPAATDSHINYNSLPQKTEH